MDIRVKEAAQVLKDRAEFNKLLQAMKEKYIKTGKLTGKVEVFNLSFEESLALSPFNPDIYEATEGKISIKKFIDYFTKGRFEGIDFLEVFFEYFGGKIITNKEKKLNEEGNKEEFIDKLLKFIKEPRVNLWLTCAFEYKKYGYNIIIKQYNDDKKLLKDILVNIEKALELIPFSDEDGIALATLSSKATKDSHYFDINRTAGKLLLQMLAYYKEKTMYYSLEEINDLLSQCGIIRDEISNYTITAGLFCYDEFEEIKGYKWFRREGEPLLLNLQNLKRIKSIVGKSGSVFVFENPTSFYEVLNSCSDLRPSLICVSGQPNTSTYTLLNKLIEGNTQIYYAGDFDPEGLIICDNLKRKYKDKVSFMCMDVSCYEKIKSNNSFKDRINKLDNITSEELHDLVNVLREKETSGYQELLTEEYINFIKGSIK